MSKATHQALPDERNRDVQIYINGEFFPRDEAKISVFDSGFLVGDGVWEGIRLHHNQFAFVDRHMDRLFAGLAAIDLDIGMTRAELLTELRNTVAHNNMANNVHVRLMITRGNKSTPSQHPGNVVSGPNIVIIAEHKRADPSISANGISLFTATVRRPPPDTLDQRLNSHSKLHEVIALIQATSAGADEALMFGPPPELWPRATQRTSSSFALASCGRRPATTASKESLAGSCSRSPAAPGWLCTNSRFRSLMSTRQTKPSSPARSER